MAEPKKISLHLGVGYTQNSPNSPRLNLKQFAPGDALTLDGLFYAKGFRTEVYWNSWASKKMLFDFIEKEKLHQMGPDDLFVLSISCHGTLREDKIGLLQLFDGVLSIHELLDHIPTGNIWLIIDACYSADTVTSIISEVKEEKKKKNLFSAVNNFFFNLSSTSDQESLQENPENHDHSTGIPLKTLNKRTQAFVRLSASGTGSNTYEGLYTAAFARAWNYGKFSDDFAAFHMDIYSTLSNDEPRMFPVHKEFAPDGHQLSSCWKDIFAPLVSSSAKSDGTKEILRGWITDIEDIKDKTIGEIVSTTNGKYKFVRWQQMDKKHCGCHNDEDSKGSKTPVWFIAEGDWAVAISYTSPVAFRKSPTKGKGTIKRANNGSLFIEEEGTLNKIVPNPFPSSYNPGDTIYYCRADNSPFTPLDPITKAQYENIHYVCS